MIDLYNNFKAVQSLKPATRTSSENGDGVDLQGFHAAMIVIDAGAWTDGTHVFEIQESSDDSNYSAVTAGDLQGAEPTISSDAGDDQIYRLGYKGSKRYLRVAVTVSGVTSGAVYGASIVVGHPRKAPVS